MVAQDDDEYLDYVRENTPTFHTRLPFIANAIFNLPAGTTIADAAAAIVTVPMANWEAHRLLQVSASYDFSVAPLRFGPLDLVIFSNSGVKLATLPSHTVSSDTPSPSTLHSWVSMDGEIDLEFDSFARVAPVGILLPPSYQIRTAITVVSAPAVAVTITIVLDVLIEVRNAQASPI